MNRGLFFAAVRKAPFAGALTIGQASGLTALLDAFEATTPALDLRFQAYMLATAFHETARTMQPIEEYGKGRGRAYGAPAGPWRQVYDGRGDVQLTWEANYKHATQRLRALGVIGAEVDLEHMPALAMRPDIAAAIMIHGMVEGWFTGKKLSDYFNDHGTDWVNARRIINGTDKAEAIAGYARQFLAALKAATDAIPETGPVIMPPKPPMAPAPMPADPLPQPAPAAPAPSAPVPAPAPAPAPPGPTPAPSPAPAAPTGGLLSIILAILKAIFGSRH